MAPTCILDLDDCLLWLLFVPLSHAFLRMWATNRRLHALAKTPMVPRPVMALKQLPDYTRVTDSTSTSELFQHLMMTFTTRVDIRAEFSANAQDLQVLAAHIAQRGSAVKHLSLSSVRNFASLDLQWTSSHLTNLALRNLDLFESSSYFGLINCNLRHLELSYCNLQHAEICRCMQHTCKQAPLLESLNLAWNRLTAAGCCQISTCLQQLTGLRALTLDSNPLGNTGFQVLSTCISTLLLSLSVNSIFMWTPLFVKPIFDTWISSLTSLSLSDNRICGTLSTDDLCDVLRMQSQLRALDLSSNAILFDRAPELCAAMKGFGSVITDLNLALCITDSAPAMASEISAFAGFLKGAVSLQRLNLSGNRLHLNGFSAYAGALPFMTSLRSLDLSENHLNDEDADELLTSVRGLSLLRDLDLGSNFDVGYGHDIWDFAN